MPKRTLAEDLDNPGHDGYPDSIPDLISVSGVRFARGQTSHGVTGVRTIGMLALSRIASRHPG